MISPDGRREVRLFGQLKSSVSRRIVGVSDPHGGVHRREGTVVRAAGDASSLVWLHLDNVQTDGVVERFGLLAAAGIDPREQQLTLKTKRSRSKRIQPVFFAHETSVKCM